MLKTGWKYTTIMLCCMLGVSWGVTQSGNVLVNGDFEKGTMFWSPWGAEAASEGCHSGKGCIIIRNSEPKWSGIDQRIQIPKGAWFFNVSGYIKTQNVQQGQKSWEQARSSIEFHDKQGTRINGYPDAAIQLVGSHDWTYFEKKYELPEETQSVLFQAAMGNCIGTAWFDDLTITITDISGNFLEARKLTGPMDYGNWYVLPSGTQGSHFVDWSGLLDAPAGKHGFVTVKEGHFFFEDGKRAKFWGTNLVGSNCFPSQSDADSLAKRLAQMGVNLVRLHHMDAFWSKPNLFGPDGGPGRTLDSSSMAAVDYLIYALKQKGIYVFMDLLVHREFPADMIPAPLPDAGGKQVGIFAREVIDLQKEFALELVNHVNPYTQTAYKEEPAILGSEFINESTIYTHFTGNLVTGYWWNRLDSLWQVQGGEPGTLASFDVDWTTEPWDMLKKGPISGNYSASLKFLRDLEGKYYDEMYQTFRKAGVRFLLAGSNMPMAILPYQQNNATYGDFIITNQYFDHPQVWKINNDWDNTIRAPFHNHSELLDPQKSLISSHVRFNVLGKPTFITEWNHCYPNEHVLEAVPFQAFYGSLQGFDGMAQFDFGLRGLGEGRIGSYLLSSMPEHLAHWVVSAPAFLRGDIQEAPHGVVEGITEKQITTLPAYSHFDDENWTLSFITKMAKDFHGSDRGDPKAWDQKYHNSEQGLISSETGELKLWYSRGIQLTQASRVQGAYGFLGPKEGETNNHWYHFPAFTFAVKNPHASVIAVSATQEPLTQSSRWYMVAQGPSRMKGQVYDPNREQLLNVGADQIEMQVLEGAVILFGVKPSQVSIQTLLPSGMSGHQVAAILHPKGTMFYLQGLHSPVIQIDFKR